VNFPNPLRQRLGVARPVIDCPPGREYDEDAFLYFLHLERARARRSNGHLQVLFATLEVVPGKPAEIPRATAARMFRALRLSLRETDVTGWFRRDRVAGALLCVDAGAPDRGTTDAIERRIRDGVRQRLPARAARTLRVRVVQLHPRQNVHES
jgi:hypothetical protein